MRMANNFTELAFTDSVQKMQEDYDTRALYEKFEARTSSRPRRRSSSPSVTGSTWRRDGLLQAQAT
jgi:hypothetical protein